MKMEQEYHWRIKTPAGKLMIHIENHPIAEQIQQDPNPNNQKRAKSFDATLQMEHQAFSRQSLFKLLIKHPAMTLKIVASIYWQATKMFVLKRFAYIPHPGQRGQHGTNN
jgi:hypothetical protein